MNAKNFIYKWLKEKQRDNQSLTPNSTYYGFKKSFLSNMLNGALSYWGTSFWFIYLLQVIYNLHCPWKSAPIIYTPWLKIYV